MKATPIVATRSPMYPTGVPDVCQDLEHAHSGTTEIIENCSGERVTAMFVRRSGVGTEPGTPSARSSMLTAIQKGFTRPPRAAERIPARVPHPSRRVRSQSAPSSGAGSGVLGWIVLDLVTRISHAASARGEDIWLPPPGESLARARRVCVWVRRVIPLNLAQPNAGLILRDVQVCIDLETLPEISIKHRPHHEAEAIGVLRNLRRAETPNRPGSENPQCIRVSRLVAVRKSTAPGR